MVLYSCDKGLWAATSHLWRTTMGYVSLLVTSLDEIMLCDVPVSLLMADLSTAEAPHTSCISQKGFFQWPQTAGIKLPVSGPPVQRSSTSLAVELGGLGCLPRALCPGRLSLIPRCSLCPEPSITVSAASPRLFLSMDHNQKKETSREGRNRSVCLGVILSKALFSGCMTPGEDQPHRCCEGAGVAQHQAVAQTGLSSWLYLSWVPPALARLGKCHTLNLPSRSYLLVCMLSLPVSFIAFILISFPHSTMSLFFSCMCVGQISRLYDIGTNPEN